MRTDERGFALLELVACVAILALAGAAAAGAFAAIGGSAASSPLRALALSTAQNMLLRARAAVAYAPASIATAASPVQGRTWALVPRPVTFVAGAQFAAPAACGESLPRTLAFPVRTTYDPANEVFSVTVTYPRDACAAQDGETATVTLSETLPPSSYAPGTTLHRDVRTPARM